MSKMSALENAKALSKEEVLKKIAAYDLEEYGLCRQNLSDGLAKVVAESKEEGLDLGVVCALNNADTYGILLEVLKHNPVTIMEGITIAAYALGTERKLLYIPEFAAELVETEALKQAADTYKVEIEIGLVDVRACKGCAIIHIVTAANLADVFNDTYEDGIFISANGAPVKKVACNTKITEIISIEDAKAVQVGYQYYTPEEVQALTVTKADNGVISVLTQKDCIVTETEKCLTASRKQSCGKCVFCREGLIQLQYMQKEIADGKGKAEFVDMTREIGEAMTFSTPCTMGQISSQVALSAVERFGDEYEAHTKKKTCPAGVCFSTETIYINPKICDGCGECMDVCPKECIEGKAGYIHMIDEFDCDRCGKCVEVCEADAIIKTSGKVPKLPNRLTRVGKFKKR